MTRDEMLALPPMVDMRTAAELLGIGKTKAYELANAGEFPVRVLALGKKSYRIPTAELLRLIGVDVSDSRAVPAA